MLGYADLLGVSDAPLTLRRYRGRRAAGRRGAGAFYMVATRAVAALALERAPHSPARNSAAAGRSPAGGLGALGLRQPQGVERRDAVRIWRALSRAHLLASNILLENTRENRCSSGTGSR